MFSTCCCMQLQYAIASDAFLPTSTPCTLQHGWRFASTCHWCMSRAGSFLHGIRLSPCLCITARYVIISSATQCQQPCHVGFWPRCGASRVVTIFALAAYRRAGEYIPVSELEKEEKIQLLKVCYRHAIEPHKPSAFNRFVWSAS